ncbi:hypothetical protein DL765_010750 [Monosporascus sp. GIB2]|nr:hypothetical protein DL765_010750 [Monosporascus sp. GIB2]
MLGPHTATLGYVPRLAQKIRASCTFTDAASAIKSKKFCPTITQSGITVPAGATLDLNGLNDGVMWDGQGGNSGKTKPKFFAAHSLKQSTISGLRVKNPPEQGFSIRSCQNLILDHIKIDNSAGDTANGGHNTDAFNVGNSSGVTISNAHVQNQDDYLAVNSGSKITFTGDTCSGGHGPSIGSVGSRSNNGVSGVRIESSSISDSQNDVRIRTV